MHRGNNAYENVGSKSFYENIFGNANAAIRGIYGNLLPQSPQAPAGAVYENTQNVYIKAIDPSDTEFFKFHKGQLDSTKLIQNGLNDFLNPVSGAINKVISVANQTQNYPKNPEEFEMARLIKDKLVSITDHFGFDKKHTRINYSLADTVLPGAVVSTHEAITKSRFNQERLGFDRFMHDETERKILVAVQMQYLANAYRGTAPVYYQLFLSNAEAQRNLWSFFKENPDLIPVGMTLQVFLQPEENSSSVQQWPDIKGSGAHINANSYAVQIHHQYSRDMGRDAEVALVMAYNLHAAVTQTPTIEEREASVLYVPTAEKGPPSAELYYEAVKESGLSTETEYATLALSDNNVRGQYPKSKTDTGTGTQYSELVNINKNMSPQAERNIGRHAQQHPRTESVSSEISKINTMRSVDLSDSGRPTQPLAAAEPRQEPGCLARLFSCFGSRNNPERDRGGPVVS